MVQVKLLLLFLLLVGTDGFLFRGHGLQKSCTRLHLFKTSARSTEEDLEKTRAVILKRKKDKESGIICEKELTASIKSESNSKSLSASGQNCDNMLIPFHDAVRVAYDMQYETYDDSTFQTFEASFYARAKRQACLVEKEAPHSKKRRRWQFWKN